MHYFFFLSVSCVTHVVTEPDGRIRFGLGLAAIVLHGSQPRHFRRTVVAFRRRKVYGLVVIVAGRARVARLRAVRLVGVSGGRFRGRRWIPRGGRKTSGRRRRFRGPYWKHGRGQTPLVRENRNPPRAINKCKPPAGQFNENVFNF